MNKKLENFIVRYSLYDILFNLFVLFLIVSLGGTISYILYIVITESSDNTYVLWVLLVCFILFLLSQLYESYRRKLIKRKRRTLLKLQSNYVGNEGSGKTKNLDNSYKKAKYAWNRLKYRN